MDGNTVDNGYIFGWELALAPDIQTIEYVDVVNTTVDGPWVTATSDSSFLFTPPANLPNDTTVSYTFHCHSQFGCGYDTVVSVTFHPRQDIVIDTTACNSLVWNGVTYTTDTTLTDSLTNVHGCDSIITVNIHVITIPSVFVSSSTLILLTLRYPISVFIIPGMLLSAITRRSILMPPEVEPEHPQNKEQSIRIPIQPVGHRLVSSVAKPVVVESEHTWKAAKRRALGKE